MSTEALTTVLGDHLTAKKAAMVIARDGYTVSGVVLVSPTGDRCLVEMSAVRWLTKDEMWWLMHTSRSPIYDPTIQPEP